MTPRAPVSSRVRASRHDSLVERLSDKFVFSPDGCWRWTGSKSKGYGEFKYLGRKHKAHRVMYELLVGPVLDDLPLDHLCRNPSCVNPAHLEPVTHRENVLRGIAPAARQAVQTHCLRGHEFTPENTYVEPSGRRRVCRACVQERKRLKKEAAHGA